MRPLARYLLASLCSCVLLLPPGWCCALPAAATDDAAAPCCCCPQPVKAPSSEPDGPMTPAKCICAEKDTLPSTPREKVDAPVAAVPPMQTLDRLIATPLRGLHLPPFLLVDESLQLRNCVWLC